MHVRGTASEIGFQAEDIGLGTVRGPAAIGESGRDLISLLIVLMGPHIGSERPGQRIESRYTVDDGDV